MNPWFLLLIFVTKQLFIFTTCNNNVFTGIKNSLNVQDFHTYPSRLGYKRDINLERLPLKLANLQNKLWQYFFYVKVMTLDWPGRESLAQANTRL